LRERYIERNPAIMGGEPVIRGTRVPVRTVAGLIEQGESREVMREDYPQVPEEAYAVAVCWARANPRRGRTARQRHPLVRLRRLRLCRSRST
jgi:uncharacterized protein (DUF433 family)